MKTTRKTLEAIAGWINDATKSPKEPYSRKRGKLVANVGNFHISGAYGGFCLHRMHNESGGVTTPLDAGHIPARELEGKMRAFLAGLDFKRAEKVRKQAGKIHS